MIADLIADLVGCRDFTKRCEKSGEQEFDKGGGIADLVASTKHPVVFRLAVVDDSFHGEKSEERIRL